MVDTPMRHIDATVAICAALMAVIEALEVLAVRAPLDEETTRLVAARTFEARELLVWSEEHKPTEQVGHNPSYPIGGTDE